MTPFLAGDAADEEDVGAGLVDAVFVERVGGLGALVFVEVDAVVDDVDFGGVDVGIGALDVGPGAVRDGDDGVRVEDGGFLHPRAEGVPRPELLSLPGAQRLKRVGGQDEGDVVKLLGEEAGHGDVPGVGVDDVDTVELLHGAEIESEGVDGGFELLRGLTGDCGWGLVALDFKVRLSGALGAPAVDFHFDLFCELLGEVFDVDAGAAVDVGWVLAGHEAYAHWGSLGIR